MGLVYLPTFKRKNQLYNHVGEYTTSTMDGMSILISIETVAV